MELAILLFKFLSFAYVIQKKSKRKRNKELKKMEMRYKHKGQKNKF